MDKRTQAVEQYARSLVEVAFSRQTPCQQSRRSKGKSSSFAETNLKDLLVAGKM